MISAWSGIRPLVVETEEDKRLLKERELLEDTTILRKAKRRFKRSIIKLGEIIHGTP